MKTRDVIARAIRDGWPWGYTYKDEDGVERVWPCCAMGASMRVADASGGVVTLAFGGGRNLKVSRYGAGNASVPKLCDDAAKWGAVVTELGSVRVGMLVIVEVRRRDKKTGRLREWKGKRCHVGIVTELARGAAGRVVGVRCHEANLGGRDRWNFYRPLVAGAKATERVVCFVDVAGYAERAGLLERIGTAPVAVADEPDGFVYGVPRGEELADDVVLPVGADYLAVPTGETEPVRACAVAEEPDEHGEPRLLLLPYTADGALAEGTPQSWEVVGCWDEGEEVAA